MLRETAAKDRDAEADRIATVRTHASRPAIDDGDEPCPPQPQAVDIKGWNVYVVDAHSLIFQVFHALPEMSSPRGEQVGAVFGFVRDMLYLIEDKKPDALICAFDLPGPTFRDELYDAYKAERGEMPDDLVGQIPEDRAGARSLGDSGSRPAKATRPTTCSPPSPASATKPGANCFIVTGDKDCRQLITDRVAVYNIRKNQVFDAAALREDWGVGPDQVVDFQALVGDKVDNVPGVPGIGPKTAQQLLETYGTLDNLLEHAAEVPGAKGKKLVECREQALLSRQLVRLDTPSADRRPIGTPAASAAWTTKSLVELFAEFGFRSFAERAAKIAPANCRAPIDRRQGELPARRHAREAGRAGRPARQAAADQRRHRNDARHAALGRDRRLFVRVQAGRGLLRRRPRPRRRARARSAETLEALRPVLENPTIRKLGQNLKYDMIVLRNAGVTLAGVAFDTMVASYLLDAGGRSHNLDDLAQRYLESHDDQDRRADRQRQATRSGWTKCRSPQVATTPPKTPTSRCGCSRSWPSSSKKWSSTKL